jgi:dihydroorotate dehydrogenase
MVGVNLAKNTASSNVKDDYKKLIESIGPHVDFIVMNISCPNVGWTSKLKDSEITELLGAVKQARDDKAPGKPVLLKISPDYDDTRIRDICQIAITMKVDGLVVSNTSKSRPDTLLSPHKIEAGGLSGRPIKDIAHRTLHNVYQMTGGLIPIVGVGGIESGEDAYQRIRAGASLIEIYTAMTFHGPGLIQMIKRDLDACLERDGFANVAEAVGADHCAENN